MSGGFFSPRIQENCSPWRDVEVPYGHALYSPPKVRVFECEGPLTLEANVDEFIANPDINVLAIGGAVPSSGVTGGDESWSSFVLTVIYQERLPLPQEPRDDEG